MFEAWFRCILVELHTHMPGSKLCSSLVCEEHSMLVSIQAIFESSSDERGVLGVIAGLLHFGIFSRSMNMSF